MFGMVMCVDECVDPPDVGCKQLLPHVRAGIDEDSVSVGLHHYRRPGPAVPGVPRVTYAPVVPDPWHSRRRAAAKQPHLHQPIGSEIGSASWRDSVWQYVSISGVVVSLKKQTQNTILTHYTYTTYIL